jgi:class 3 adenylate cyclase
MDTAFTPTRKIIAVFDLSGFAKSFQREGDERMAAFTHDYYSVCEEVILRRCGEIIKFIGDACLATFSPDDAAHAVEAARILQARVVELSKQHQIPTALGSNLHLASAIEGDYGTGSSRRRDIIGRGVNQAFLLGRGEGSHQRAGLPCATQFGSFAVAQVQASCCLPLGSAGGNL